jgi:hypothetical protein
MIDRSVFLLGWRTGSLLRGLRNKVPEVPEEPDVPDQRYDVTFEDGILYIRKAPAVMNINGIDYDVLSFAVWDLENEEE